MAKIEMKFSSLMGYYVSAGLKCSTIRVEKKGNVGDVFIHDGYVYRLLRIVKLFPESAVKQYYDLEGFQTPKELADELNQIYPTLEFNSRVWVHVFARVGEAEE